MAKIRVYRREADGEDFPRLCMRCGGEADRDVPQTFSWMPGWVFLLLLGGLLPFLLVALLTRKTMRIVAPMCQAHAGHWRVRKLYVWLGLLFWVVYGIALGAFNNDVPAAAIGPLVLFGIFGSLVWLVSAVVFAHRAIKAVEIRHKSMDLANVNRDFADAWNDAVD